MKRKFTECSRCGKDINFGDAYVTIVRNVEQADFEIKHNREEIDIIDSEELITFCGKCGNAFDAKTIVNIINAIPSGSKSFNDN